MRVLDTSAIVFTSKVQALNATARRSIFVESADPVDLKARVAAAFAALFVESPQVVWTLAHADLAGGGDGHTFVFWAEAFDPAVLGGDGFALENGEAGESTDPLFWMAAQSEALDNVNSALIASTMPPATEMFIVQTFFGGASQGTRFMGGYFGEVITDQGGG